MEEKINTKIAEIKTTIKEITKHFNYDEEVINILTIVYFFEKDSLNRLPILDTDSKGERFFYCTKEK